MNKLLSKFFWMPQHLCRLALEDKQPEPTAVTKPKIIAFAQVEKQLTEAKMAQERLLRECQAKVVVRAVASKDTGIIQDLKIAMNLLQQNLQKLNECILWKDLWED